MNVPYVGTFETGHHQFVRPLAAARKPWTQALGPDHPGTLNMLTTLAMAYQEAGRTADAIRLLERLRDQSTQRLGANHPHTLTVLNELAEVYRIAGRTEKAVSLYEQLRQRISEKLGPDHPLTLKALNELTGAYWVVGKVEPAAPPSSAPLRNSFPKGKLPSQGTDALRRKKVARCLPEGAGASHWKGRTRTVLLVKLRRTRDPEVSCLMVP